MEGIIGCNFKKEKWSEFAMTDFTKEKIKNIKPCEKINGRIIKRDYRS